MEQQKRYGHFDDQHREYVITDPQTPWPWINYLGNEDFFSLISNTAGGYSFYKDAKFRRITRYRYNNVPMDNGGRYFYIKDGETVWNPGWKPCKTPLDFYECRHGMSYTRITGKKNGVEASVLFFVPLKKWCEVQKLTLKNESKEVKQLKLFSFEEWCLWNAATDMENFQRNFSTGEVEIEGSTIYHKTEYRERRNHYAFYHVNSPIQGFDTDRETFVGLYNEFADPQAVMEGKPRNSHAHGWSPSSSCWATSRTSRTINGNRCKSSTRRRHMPSSPNSILPRKLTRHSLSSAPSGIISLIYIRYARATTSSTAWSTSGTSTSVWSPSTSLVRHRSSRVA